MKQKKILFIGAGNMGSAIIHGIITNRVMQENTIAFFDPQETVRKKVAEKTGAQSLSVMDERVKEFDVLILAVKPQIFYHFSSDPAMCLLQNYLNENQIIVSIMAGVTIKKIQDFFKKTKKIIRVMPNTPAIIGKAMSVLSPSEEIAENELLFVKEIFQSIGETEVLAESLLDAVTGLSGSGPAFVMMFIEALTQGGILCGLSKNTAEKLAIQTVIGSCEMIGSTGKTVEELRHMVTSPGGTTIAGIAALEENQLRSGVIKAVKAAYNRSKELGKD